MIGLRTAAVMLGLLMLPGSCIAAEPTPPPKPKPKMAAVAVAPRPVPPPQMAMAMAIGKFRLDRQPQQGIYALGTVPQGTKRLVIDGRDVGIATDGRFGVGFGRDYATTTLITAFLADGQSVTERLPVGKWAWKIENLSRLPHHSQPDAEFQSRRPGELAQINAARRIASDAGGWRQRFVWPSRGRISGLFGSQRIYAGQPGAPHSGVDVAGPTGAPVVAPADGVVTLAASSPFTLEGNLLMIDHGMGLNSAFLHLSKIDVKAGDIVRQGQRVGSIGATGRATGPHLHWGMKWHDERIDPQRLAGPMM
jgi:murein DD-endopeptidase MepM/ murein hydrolase activator NlpD